MATKADLKALKEKFNIGADDIWDCHGTWVMLHRACESVAMQMGIQFDEPKLLFAEGESIALLVTGRVGEDSAWSIGESSPKNNKNAYPWAMAEKRAKDRVTLKLARLSEAGVYSDIEADDFKKKDKPDVDWLAMIQSSRTLNELASVWESMPVEIRHQHIADKDARKAELS